MSNKQSKPESKLKTLNEFVRPTPGDLIIIAGFSASGKTALVRSWLRDAAMTNACFEPQGLFYTNSSRSEIHEELQEPMSQGLVVISSYMINPELLPATIAEYQECFTAPPSGGVIVLDTLQSAVNSDRDYSGMSRIIRELKRYAVGNDAIAICVIQINENFIKSRENPEIEQGDIAKICESAVTEADVILTTHGIRKNGAFYVSSVKNRRNENQCIPLFCNNFYTIKDPVINYKEIEGLENAFDEIVSDKHA